MGISLTSSGNYATTEAFLKKMLSFNIGNILRKYGEQGRAALAAATPVDSSLAASSWTFDVTQSRSSAEIVWRNTDIESGFPVAIMLQYGHGTGTGGYVQGRDYINPVIKPLFDAIEAAVFEEVSRA